MENENKWSNLDYDKINWGKLKWHGLTTSFAHTYVTYSTFLRGSLLRLLDSEYEITIILSTETIYQLHCSMYHKTGILAFNHITY